MTDCQIYVASLSDYNAGVLHGVWIALDEYADAEGVQEEIDAMLGKSREPGAEEWAIHDHEGFPANTIGEHTSLAEVCAIAAFIAEHDDVARAAISNWTTTEAARAAVEDRFRGTYASKAAFAEEFTEEHLESAGATLPAFLLGSIDYEHVARELEWGSDFDFVEFEGEVYVFST